MTYTIKNNLLYKNNVQIKHYRTSKTSGTMRSDPKFIVIHYTAGINFSSDIQTLTTSSAQASCQLVLSPEGEWAQIGNFKDILWHAGKSQWKGYNSLNSNSIGIEVTCPGWVEYSRTDSNGVRYFKYPGGREYWNDRDFNIVEARHKNGGPVKYWLEFTRKQLEALREVIPVLVKHYNIQEVVGHDMISPDRKIDPGPCLPEGFYSEFNGVNPVGRTIISGTGGSGVNVRSGPGTEYSKVGGLSENSEVTVLETKSGWASVRSGGLNGWVSDRYLKTM